MAGAHVGCGGKDFRRRTLVTLVHGVFLAFGAVVHRALDGFVGETRRFLVVTTVFGGPGGWRRCRGRRNGPTRDG